MKIDFSIISNLIQSLISLLSLDLVNIDSKPWGVIQTITTFSTMGFVIFIGVVTIAPSIQSLYEKDKPIQKLNLQYMYLPLQGGLTHRLTRQSSLYILTILSIFYLVAGILCLFSVLPSMIFFLNYSMKLLFLALSISVVFICYLLYDTFYFNLRTFLIKGERIFYTLINFLIIVTEKVVNLFVKIGNIIFHKKRDYLPFPRFSLSILSPEEEYPKVLKYIFEDENGSNIDEK